MQAAAPEKVQRHLREVRIDIVLLYVKLDYYFKLT